MLGYLQLLSSGGGIDPSDLGLLEKFKRSLGTQLANPPAADEAAITQIAQAEMFKAKPNPAIVEAWVQLPWSAKHPEWMAGLTHSSDSTEINTRIKAMSMAHWKGHPELMEDLITRLMSMDQSLSAGYKDVFVKALSQPHWADHPELIERLLARQGWWSAELSKVLAMPHWAKHPELALQLIHSRPPTARIAEELLGQPHWARNSELIDAFVDRLPHQGDANLQSAARVALLTKVFTLPQVKPNAELLARAAPMWNDLFNGRALLTQKRWVDAVGSKPILDVLKANRNQIHENNAPDLIFKQVLSQPAWADHPEIIREIATETPEFSGMLMRDVLATPAWASHLHPLGSALLKESKVPANWVAVYLLKGQPPDPARVALLGDLLAHIKENPPVQDDLVWTTLYEKIFHKPGWGDHPQLLQASLAPKPG